MFWPTATTTTATTTAATTTATTTTTTTAAATAPLLSFQSKVMEGCDGISRLHRRRRKNSRGCRGWQMDILEWLALLFYWRVTISEKAHFFTHQQLRMPNNN